MRKTSFYGILITALTIISGCASSSLEASSQPSESSLDSSTVSSTIESSSLISSSEVSISSSTSSETIVSSSSFVDYNYTFPSEPYTGYYESISTNTVGSALRVELYNLMQATQHTNVSYDSLRNHFQITDRDPDIPGNIILFYTGTSRPFNGTFGSTVGTTNREHVWPQSKFNYATSGPYSDLHHVRPCDMSLNSTRGNMDFGTLTSGTVPNEGVPGGTRVPTDALYSGGKFYPGPLFRGPAARVIFYVAMRYGPESVFNLTLMDAMAPNPGTKFAFIADMLAWNLEYPVNDYETLRNEETEKIQGNRNPFIDHPDLACRLWGDYNAKTIDVCGLL